VADVLDPLTAVFSGVTPEVRPGGELLPGWYEDWVLVERKRLRQLRMHALEALAEKLTEAGRYGVAMPAAYAAVRADPVRESAHRAVVRVHLAEGTCWRRSGPTSSRGDVLPRRERWPAGRPSRGRKRVGPDDARARSLRLPVTPPEEVDP
jgi:hypothetical protein